MSSDTTGGINRQSSYILDVVAGAAENILTAEALLLKRLGIDETPIIAVESELGESHNREALSKLEIILKCDKGQQVNDLIKQIVDNASMAVLEIHKGIDSIPQNRPFGKNTTIERLTIENLNMMHEILEYDKISSAEFWSAERIKEIEGSLNFEE